MKKISRIAPARTGKPALKRVAAYARVSMETERLRHSLSAQVSRYSEMIRRTPGWEYAGVYADYGISGTGTKERSEFLSLLSDCEAGKIDIVLCKSISRFARNTVDLLNTVRRLKELGISVRFEKENIDTLTSDGELLLTLLASFAQEESRSISENVKWGTRKRFAMGIPNGHVRVYGYRWEGDRLAIVPEEAEIVKLIYGNYLRGVSAETTEKQLAGMGVKSMNGLRFGSSSIRHILNNITYTGNLLLQKEYIADPITGKSKINRGELPQYFVEDTHEAIIPMETWRRVQDEMARRRELGVFANWSIATNCFTGKIKCGICSRSFVRSTRTNRAKMSQLGERYVFWGCTSRKRAKRPSPPCASGTIREAVLKEECAKVLGLDEFDEAVFAEKVERITIPETGTLIFDFKDGTQLTRRWSRNAKKDCWTDEMRKRASDYRRTHTYKKDGVTCFTSKIQCECCGCNYLRQSRTAADSTKQGYWRCSGGKACSGRWLREDHLRDMCAEILGTEQFDETSFRAGIKNISVRGTHLTFHFTDGRTAERDYAFKKEGTPWTEERRRKYMETRRAHPMGEEKRKAISERMRKLRKERGASWRREK